MQPSLENRNYRLRAKTSGSLISLVLSLLLSVPAHADPLQGLVAENASMDVVKAPDTQIATPSPGSVTLYGSVKKREAALDATADDNATKLQSEAAANAQESLFRLAVKKLAAGAELSSDE